MSRTFAGMIVMITVEVERAVGLTSPSSLPCMSDARQMSVSWIPEPRFCECHKLLSHSFRVISSLYYTANGSAISITPKIELKKEVTMSPF